MVNKPGFPSKPSGTGYDAPASYYVVQYKKEDEDEWHDTGDKCQPGELNKITIQPPSAPTAAAVTYLLRTIGCYNEEERKALLRINKEIIKESKIYYKDQKVKLEYHETEGHVNVTWTDLDSMVCDRISYYQVETSYKKVFCPKTSTSNSPMVKLENLQHDLSVEPYAHYNVTLLVRCEPNYQSFRSEVIKIFTMGFEKIQDDEKPSIEKIDTGISNVTVFFRELACGKIKGALFINYEALSNNPSCCKSSTLQDKTGISFPIPNYALNIIDLSPGCRYRIGIYLSRSNTDWKKKLLLENTFTIETKYTDNFAAAQAPSVETASGDKTSVQVYFKTHDCNKFVWNINYEAISQNSCCNTIGFQTTSNIKLPEDGNPLVIRDLSPNCDYVIRLKLSTGGRSIQLRAIPVKTEQVKKGPINDQELPLIESSVAEKESIVVYFKGASVCSRGPLTLKYDIESTAKQDTWCSLDTGQNYNIPVPDGKFNIYVPKLQTYCRYKIRFHVHRNGYNRTIPPEIVKTTKPWVIGLRIRELKVTSKGPDHISLRWLPPSPPTGELREYSIHEKSDLGVLKTVSRAVDKSKCNLWLGYHCYTSSKVKEGTSYNISIFAINVYDSSTNLAKEIETAKDEGRFEHIVAETREAKPESPYNVTVILSSDHPPTVSWHHPNATNGQVRLFKIEVTYSHNLGEGRTSERYLIKDPTEYKSEYNKDLNVSFKQQKKLILFKVCVITAIGESKSTRTSECQDTNVRIPPPDPREYKKVLKFENRKLIFLLPDVDDFFQVFYILKAPTSIPSGNLERELTKFNDDIKGFKDNIYKELKIHTLFYTSNRSRFSSTHKLQLDWLKNDTDYHITVVIVNELNGIRTVRNNFQRVKASNHEVELPLDYSIVAVIIIVMILVPLLGLILYRYRNNVFRLTTRFGDDFVFYSMRSDTISLAVNESKNEYEHMMDEVAPPRAPPTLQCKRVKIESLGDYVKSAIERDELIRQHELFPRSDVLIMNDPMFTCESGNLPENKAKNRYKNIIAYDHTRVKLAKSSDISSDYINANYINGYKMPKAYIATQGPKPNTLNDFWNMIWENRVNYIVMLTNLFDGQKKNCEQYWPEEKEHSLNFAGVLVELVEVNSFLTYDERIFRVSLDERARKVTQIHFKVWPSHGQPLFPQTLVPLLHKMLTIPYSSKTPILVHCSAGIGRTGTILLCDMCLRMAAVEGAVDVLGTLRSLRNQRPNMVDNFELYKLAHLAILAALTARNTRIPCDGRFETAIDNILKEGGISSQMDYIRESEWQDDAMKTVALSDQRHVPIVPEKNRHPDILPDKICQVLLQQLPGQGATSCYINAIYVDSFHSPNRYIVTQHPLPATLGDFWRLVLEQQCTVITNLNPVKAADETSKPFWPEQQSLLVIDDNIQIRHVKTSNTKELSSHKLLVIHNSDGFEKTDLRVDILNFNRWPNDKVTPESIEELVSFTMDTSSMGKKALPMIVTCQYHHHIKIFKNGPDRYHRE